MLYIDLSLIILPNRWDNSVRIGSYLSFYLAILKTKTKKQRKTATHTHRKKHVPAFYIVLNLIGGLIGNNYKIMVNIDN